MEEKKERILIRIAALFLFGLTLWIFLGCGSKKKQIQKSQFTTEIATVERVSEVEEKDVKTEVSESETSKETTTSNNENFEGEIADHTKPATVTTEEKYGKKIKTYTNFKKVKTGDQNSESETNKTFGQNLSKTDKSKTDKSNENETDFKASGKSTDKDLKVERGFPWHWVVLAVLIYALISYKRKSMKPWRWFL